MDTIDIREWLDAFQSMKALSDENRIKLGEVFESMEDGTDSALKIVVPLLIAYSNIDQIYGPQADKILTISISEKNQMRIVLNVPGFVQSIQAQLVGTIVV